jgi:magnesium transporter
MDAFASIISNNQNQVMKRLTSITIMLQLPTLVASIYGMNVPIPGQHTTFAFYFPILLSLGLSLLIGLYFMRKKLF